MSGLRILAQLTRCSRWSAFPRVISFSTSSRSYDDLWGKMATSQELQSNAKQRKVDLFMLDEEREEAMRKINQLKQVIRESEHKLTGLQRMKYMQDETNKGDTAVEQMRAMRVNVKAENLEIEPVVTHTVHEIRNDRKFRFAQSFANLFTAFALCVICLGLYNTLQRKVEEKETQKAGNLNSKEDNTVKESNVTASSNKSEDTSQYL